MTRLQSPAAATIVAAGLILGAVGGARAQCNSLNPVILNEMLGAGQLAFRLDDEGLAATPLYLDLRTISSTGTFGGTISTAAETPSNGTYYSVSGALAQDGTNGLTISFTYKAAFNAIDSYSGSIVLFQSCNLFIAGTYGVSVLLFPHVYTSGPFPFSGQVVGYQYE